ncbi:MAG: low specificity L-threonine aldolase [Clostridia bacterium]|nr:low specificity L-threonine aldolase [Clostridia bacterium]
MYRFECDYQEGCIPPILERLAQTNLEQTVGYGMDPYCEEAARLIKERFSCPDAAVFFLTGGTQANACVISSILKPYEGVLCAETAHINAHETGAIEHSGHKVLALPGREGRITGTQVSVAVALQGDSEHTVKPGMVYISMSTELGTIYNLTTLSDLSMVCRQNHLPLYLDGARLGYALTSPVCDVTPADVARLCDVFTVGGTKQGALFGEAVVIVNPALKRSFRYIMKQQGGLLAKGRLLGLQFAELMRGDAYFTYAQKAVNQAMRIRDALLKKGLPLFVDSPTNQLFVILTDEQLETFEDDFAFEVWERVDEDHSCVRICTSWATSDGAVTALLQAIEGLE